MLTPCAGCRRHVEEIEPKCPFCGAAVQAARIVPVLEGRLSRAAVFASAVLVAPACVVNDPPPPQYVQQPPPPDDPRNNRPPNDPPNGPPPYESHDFAKPPPDDQRPPPPYDRPPPPPVANAVVRGRITMNGNPLAGAQISLHGGPSPVTVTTDADGWYSARVPEGEYQMHVGAGGGAHRTIRAEAGREVLINVAVAPYARQNNAKPYGAPPARRRIV
jgi:hypothetical protein